MARRHDRKGNSIGESRHIRLYHWLMATAAWQHLDAVARAAYLDLAALYNGSNNGRIVRSVREAAGALHVSPATAMRAHQRLEAVGFIVKETNGAFSRKIRHAAEWRLTEFGNDLTGELASKEFTRWRPENSAQVIVMKQKNLKHGTSGETNCYRGETLGARGETLNGKKGRLGASGETWNPQNTPLSGYPGETHIVYQGVSPSAAPVERSRSAPPGSAVASDRVTSHTKSSLLPAPSTGRTAA